MQTTRPRILWKVLPMAPGCHFKEIFDQVRKDLDCELFILNLKTSQRLSIMLLSPATDNIPHRVKKTITPC